MANKTFTSYYSNGLGRIRFILNIYTVSTSIKDNTSTERAELYAYVDNASSGWFNLYGSPVSATINNVVKSANTAWDYRSTGKKVLISTWDTVVTHDTNGKKTINVSASHTTNVGLGTASISDTYECDTIPRASTISATSGYIGDTINIIADRKADNFTHTLTWGFGTLNGTIATKSSNTSFTFTIPESFYAQIPNSKTGSGKFYCTTYDGNTQIGDTQEAVFSVYTNEEICRPTVTINAVETGKKLETGNTTTQLLGSANKIIKGYSDVKITATSVANKNSTISSSSVLCSDGQTSTNLSVTFNTVQGNIFTIISTDSRGYTNSATKTLTMVNYDNIKTTTFILERESQVSSTVNLILVGTYWNNNFGAKNNTLVAKYRYKISGDTDSAYSDYAPINITKQGNDFSYNGALKKASGENEEFSYRNPYTFEIVITDEVQNYKLTHDIPKGKPVFSYGEEDFTVHDEFRFDDKILKKENDGYKELILDKEKYLFAVKTGTVINVETNKFVAIALPEPFIDEMNCYHSGNTAYKVPETAYYRITLNLRLKDIVPNNMCGVGIRLLGYDTNYQSEHNSTGEFWQLQRERATASFTTILRMEKDCYYKPEIYLSPFETMSNNDIIWLELYIELIKK